MKTTLWARVTACFNPLWVARRALRQALLAQAHLARGRLLDLGCGTQPYRDLFGNLSAFIRFDVPPNPNVDVWGDGMALPFPDAIFDTVLCNQVLEHVNEPSKLMAEAARVLKPGGILLLTTPQTWGLHLEPHDYFRFTQYGLRYLAQQHGLEVIAITPTCGLWATLAQRLADTVIFTYARGSSKPIYKFLCVLMSPILLIGYVLDKPFGYQGDTLDNLLVARKLYGTA